MINEHVFVESDRLRLVPYLSCFTPRYHEWMCDPELLALTESEPLSLAEEQDNQHSWLYALDKLTFIILAPRQELESSSPSAIAFPASTSVPFETTQPCSHPTLWVREAELRVGCSEAFTAAPSSPPPSLFLPAAVRHGWTGEPAAAGLLDTAASFVMIGDCNLFLLQDEAEEEGDGPELSSSRVFEVEVMIAEKSFQRQGLAKEAVCLLMLYAVEVLGATGFVAKILEDNTASLALFQSGLGFSLIKRVPVFHEIHFGLRLSCLEERQQWLRSQKWRGDKTERRVIFGPYNARRHTETPIFTCSTGLTEGKSV